MPASTTLLIAYPKELIRMGLRAMLEKSRITIVAEAENAASTLTLTKKHRPDVVLLDAAIPGGDSFDLLKKIRKMSPDTKFIMLSALDNPTYMARAQAAGASNFLLKSVGQKELVGAIETAASGTPTRGSGLFVRIASSMTNRAPFAGPKTDLTPREEQVLRHIALGLSNKEVAESLGISVETVKEHVQNLLRKLGVRDRTQAAVWAVQSGVV